MPAPVPEAGPDHLRPHLQWLPVVGFASLIGVLGFYLPKPDLQMMAWGAALTTGVTAVFLMFRDQILWARQLHAASKLQSLLAEDSTPCFTTNGAGEILFRNRAAEMRFGRRGSDVLLTALGGVFAHPSAVLYRLQGRAARKGHAREDLVTRQGHLRLSVHLATRDTYLWRFEEFSERGQARRGADSLSLPMLVASGTGTILYLNEPMRRILGNRPRNLDRVFTNLPVQSGSVVTVAAVDGNMRAVALRVEGTAERSEIYLLPLSILPQSKALTEVEDLPIALLHLQSDGLVRAANREARSLLGVETGGDCNLSDLLEGLGRPLRDWVSDVAEGRLPGRTEVLRQRHSPEERFLQVSLRRVGPSSEPSLIAAVSDATALKTLEAQFVQSQKMQAIGHLAGGIAHDFNNLLTAISGHCDLLLMRHGTSDPDYADLAQIHQNSNRAAALVHQLLAFSRKQTLNPEILLLPDVLEDVTVLLKRLVGEKIKLALEVADNLGPIRADRRQLEQVLINLVVNARDAMPKGGTIKLAAKTLRLNAPLNRDRATVPVGDYALLQIIDRGEGIAPEIIDKVFEPFFTTKRIGEGTGLGLPTAYGIVKQSGGFIFVDSNHGEGTVFSMYFPIRSAQQAAPEPVRAAIRPTAMNGEGIVLLVEDEPSVRAFASRALRLRGFSVLEADSGEAALEILADTQRPIDIVVSDVIMPGLDGPTWVKRAQQDRPQLRVVFVSGYAQESFDSDQADIPNSVFLPKPFSLDALTSTVRDALGRTAVAPLPAVAADERALSAALPAGP